MKKTQDGFSMIEVLVASTLMIIVVMMLGLMFNQTSQVWRTGTQRVDMFKDVRSLFGAFQRDASAAVDQSTIPLELRNLVAPGQQQRFSGSSVAFFTLTGTGSKTGTTVSDGGVPKRALSFVTYNGGARIEQWIGDGTAPLIGLSQTLTRDNCTFRAFSVETSGNVRTAADTEFPSFVTVSMDATSELSSSYDVGAASAGPDRIFGQSVGDSNGRDDIRTWVEK